MRHTEAEQGSSDFNRRDFIRNTSFGTLMMLMGGVPLEAAEAPADGATPENTGYNTTPPPVACGVIGCGLWGREIVQTLGMLMTEADEKLNKKSEPYAPVVALCDTYEPLMNRAKREFAPNAQTFTDYHQLLALKEVEAVVVATPSHMHREIVEAALKAGKHVYCEAPLAITVPETLAIGKAAKASAQMHFQSGLQQRADPQNWKNLLHLCIGEGAIGEPIMARSQWHKKQSWRRQSPDADREKALNWRLEQATSPGLMGELGIHQMDLMTFFLGKPPTAVTGWGGILNWKDGRDVPDTIQSVVEYPRGVNFTYDASLSNSFDSDYDVLYGAFAAVLMRHMKPDSPGSTTNATSGKAWMFKEVDSPLLGWEVYARKDAFYQETGISLALDATKQAALQKKADDKPVAEKTSLQWALEAFVWNASYKRSLLKGFVDANGADAMDEYPAWFAQETRNAEKDKKIKPHADIKEGVEATVCALKANEAIVKGQGTRIVMQKEWFEF